jgi:hypothetical protein
VAGRDADPVRAPKDERAAAFLENLAADGVTVYRR